MRYVVAICLGIAAGCALGLVGLAALYVSGVAG